MTQNTEIDDPHLVKGLTHPLRIALLRALGDRIASPRELATELDAPLGNVSYHVRYLARVGLIELVRTEPRRGAVEHYYRAVGGFGRGRGHADRLELMLDGAAFSELSTAVAELRERAAELERQSARRLANAKLPMEGSGGAVPGPVRAELVLMLHAAG